MLSLKGVCSQFRCKSHVRRLETGGDSPRCAISFQEPFQIPLTLLAQRSSFPVTTYCILSTGICIILETEGLPWEGVWIPNSNRAMNIIFSFLLTIQATFHGFSLNGFCILNCNLEHGCCLEWLSAYCCLPCVFCLVFIL